MIIGLSEIIDIVFYENLKNQNNYSIQLNKGI